LISPLFTVCWFIELIMFDSLLILICSSIPLMKFIFSWALVFVFVFLHPLIIGFVQC
jgi:hypothetical protein